MNRTVRMLRNGFALLMLLALAASAAWLIVQSRPRPPQVAQTSPLPTPTVQPTQPPAPPPSATAPPPSPSPSPTARQPGPPPLPTQAAGRVPFCTFPGGGPPEKGGPGLDKYEFSEPRVVITSTISLFIADWLPDSQRLLISRITGGPDVPAGTVQVGTFDVRNDEIRTYGKSPSQTAPFWLPQSQAVAYIASEWEDQARGLMRSDLWISQGDPGQAQQVIKGLRDFPDTVVDSSGTLIQFTEPGQQPSQVPDAARRFFQMQTVPFAPKDWVYPKYATLPRYMDQNFNVARRPGGTHIAFYSDPYLFLYKPQGAEVCEVDLGRGSEGPIFPFQVAWSPNGRRLAMVTTSRFPGSLVPFTNLIILDLNTGELVRPQLPPRVRTMAWATNSQHIVTLVATQSSDNIVTEQLFLVDAFSGAFRPMLPQHVFLPGGAEPSQQMAWASNGKDLAVKCALIGGSPTHVVEDRICLIATEAHP